MNKKLEKLLTLKVGDEVAYYDVKHKDIRLGKVYDVTDCAYVVSALDLFGCTRTHLLPKKWVVPEEYYALLRVYTLESRFIQVCEKVTELQREIDKLKQTMHQLQTIQHRH